MWNRSVAPETNGGPGGHSGTTRSPAWSTQRPETAGCSDRSFPDLTQRWDPIDLSARGPVSTRSPWRWAGVVWPGIGLGGAGGLGVCLGRVNIVGALGVFLFMSRRVMTGRTALAERRAETKVVAVSFAEFYRQNYRSVVGIVYALSGSPVAAEELTQDAFLRAHHRWDDLSGHANREAWVKRVAINLARSWLRRRVVEVRVLARLGRERPVVEPMSESADQLWDAVRGLPRQQAAAIALRYHDDRSIDDIALVLECSPATVRVHLHRGRRALATQLDLELGEESDGT